MKQAKIKSWLIHTVLALLMIGWSTTYISGWRDRLDLFDKPNYLHTKYLIPDGGHPNRLGHKILFDFLTENDPWLNKEKK